MKNRRTQVIILTALIIAMSLAGCASFPIPEDGSDTLLVINRILDRNTSESSFVKYKLYIDGETEPYISFDSSDKMLLVLGLTPGDHVIDAIHATNPSNGNSYVMRGSESVPFTLKQGWITILDRSVVSTVKATTSGRSTTITQSFTIAPLTEEEKNELLDDIADSENGMLWEPVSSR